MLLFTEGFQAQENDLRGHVFYIDCNLLLSGDTLSQGLVLIQLLTQTVEKVAGQPFQVLLISESVFASSLLLELLASDVQPGESLLTLKSFFAALTPPLACSACFVLLHNK